MIDKSSCLDKTDSELVKFSLKNSDYYFCLMNRYESSLLNYIHRLVSISPYDAEDILQESFIKAYKNLNDFDFQFEFKNWIYRIVHNQTLNLIRHHRLHLHLSLDNDNHDFLEWLSSGVDIEKETINQHFIDHIHTLIDLLDDKYKQVIMLKFIEGFDYKEISDILKKPTGTISTLLNRAKKQFKKIYETNQPKNS